MFYICNIFIIKYIHNLQSIKIKTQTKKRNPLDQFLQKFEDNGYEEVERPFSSLISKFDIFFDHKYNEKYLVLNQK